MGSLKPEAETAIQQKIMALLNKYPYLIAKIGQPGWAALLCLHYWAEYHGLHFRISDWRLRTMPSPETLLRIMRTMRISPATRDGALYRGLQKSGPIDSYSAESGD